MFKKRYSNLRDAKSRHNKLSDIRHLIHDIRVLQKTLSLDDVTCDNSAALKEKMTHLENDYIVWLGHACYLIRLDNKHLLIDPFFSKYASPLQFLGPKRIVPSALSIAELPKIDYVLVTHNHYDHLDKNSIKQLENRFSPLMIVPEGLARTLKGWGVKNTHDLAWQQAITLDNIVITALPAYHYSRRCLFDLNVSWWCSFAIVHKNLKLFHAGDTGYGDNFKVIGQQFTYFDYAMIGIGAYMPRKMMEAVHLNPEEAVQIVIDINAKTLLPMHWGTIPLTSEPFAEPMQRLLANKALAEHEIKIALKNIGDTLEIK